MRPLVPLANDISGLDMLIVSLLLDLNFVPALCRAEDAVNNAHGFEGLVLTYHLGGGVAVQVADKTFHQALIAVALVLRQWQPVADSP